MFVAVNLLPIFGFVFAREANLLVAMPVLSNTMMRRTDAADRANIARVERARRHGQLEMLNEGCVHRLKSYDYNYDMHWEFNCDMLELLHHCPSWDCEAVPRAQLDRLIDIVTRDDADLIDDPSEAGEWFFMLPNVDANLVAELWAYSSFHWASQETDKLLLENVLNDIILMKFQDVEQYFFLSLEFICLLRPMWDDDEHYGYNAYLPESICLPSEREDLEYYIQYQYQ